MISGAEQAAEKLDQDAQEVRDNLEKQHKTIADGQTMITEFNQRIEELQHQRDAEQGGKLESLEKDLKDKEKEVIKVESALKNLKDSKKQEEKKKTQIIKGRTTVSLIFALVLKIELGFITWACHLSNCSSTG